MNAALTSWGPALLICLTVIIGIVYNSSRITGLRSYMDARFNAVDRRFDDMKGDVNQRFDDMRDLLKSEIKRHEDRVSPIHRG
jgi:hypothetical protein